MFDPCSHTQDYIMYEKISQVPNPNGFRKTTLNKSNLLFGALSSSCLHNVSYMGESKGDSKTTRKLKFLILFEQSIITHDHKIGIGHAWCHQKIGEKYSFFSTSLHIK